MTTLPSTFRLRAATSADASLLATLAAETFTDAFGAQNTAENLAAFIEARYSPDIQRAELADPALTYLIAEVEGKTAGYALVREGATPACVTGPLPVEVQRFYVLRDWHGAGVAQALMEGCVAEARRRGGRTLWLGVWEINPRAIRFYEKCGYRQVGTQTFMVGSDAQRDRVLARPVELPASAQGR